MKTYIVDVKRNALDDGPGIRTLIFFKGCPLSCVWCQNPETKSPFQEISFDKENCSKCEKCVDACDLGAISFSNKYRINRSICNLCGKCVEVCPNNALKFVGTEYNIDDLINLILKDKVFYDNSGGGITLSGGEPTFHIDYAHELLKELKKENIHTCLETCGYYNSEKFKDLMLPYLDLIYFDMKIYDSNLHLKYCNKSNVTILKNFEDLIKNENVEILPRIPLIPNITSTEENLKNLAKYLTSLNIRKIEMLPYNPLWLSKVETIGKKTDYSYSEWLNKEEKNKIKSIFSEFDFNDF
ncbi:MAG: glycyl-radical enzyme activating protein [Promethearchaeota archaeon]